MLPPNTALTIFDSLLAGLEDYSTDQRGDVGSWIRMACVKGIADYSTAIISNASSISRSDEYLPLAKFHEGIAGILKQGVERLDNVRQQAGEQLLRLLSYSSDRDTSQADRWRIHGDHLMHELFLRYVSNFIILRSTLGLTNNLFRDDDEVGWNESSWLFPRVVKLLAISEYRHAVLSGLVLSVSSKTDSTVCFHPLHTRRRRSILKARLLHQQRPVSASLVAYAQELAVNDEAVEYDLCRLAADLLVQAKRNLASNSIVIPVLQTFNILLDADVFEELEEDPNGLKR